MADIAASNVTHTVISKRVSGVAPQNVIVATIAFGNGSLTYPSGGVPITKGKLGCPNAISSLQFVDMASANGLVYKYDATNEKIRIYEGDYAQTGDAALAELDSGSDAPAAATLRVQVEGW